jgi:hypothetical protein
MAADIIALLSVSALQPGGFIWSLGGLTEIGVAEAGSICQVVPPLCAQLTCAKGAESGANGAN